MPDEPCQTPNNPNSAFKSKCYCVNDCNAKIPNALVNFLHKLLPRGDGCLMLLATCQSSKLGLKSECQWVNGWNAKIVNSEGMSADMETSEY
mmetsp:Transcript_5502/g.9791  ORF Transcript_5502/g.9791 Transcript_5502/m.9791 type:complete len:92 (-) Transcript_5502:26-301(-)